MHTYEQMADVMDIMWKNLMEAEDYMKEAYEWKDSCRSYADWCRSMASGHMSFNETGKNVYDRLHEKLRDEPEHAHEMHVILAVMNHQWKKIAKHTAEINSMINSFK